MVEQETENLCDSGSNPLLDDFYGVAIRFKIKSRR